MQRKETRKMRIFSLKSLFAVSLAGLLTGCSTLCRQDCEPAVVKAVYTSTPVQLDGNLNEAAWQTAPSHWLQLGRMVYDRTPPAMQASVGKVLRDPGEYRAWVKILYVGAIFFHSDLQPTAGRTTASLIPRRSSRNFHQNRKVPITGAVATPSQ